MLDWGTMVGSAAIQTAIGGVFYFAVQRNMEKIDRLSAKVELLERERIAGIERQQDADTRSRKEMHNQISELQRSSVTVQTCRETHRELVIGQQEFRAAVIDLASVKTEIRKVADFVSDVNERGIALLQDVARIQGAQQKRG